MIGKFVGVFLAGAAVGLGVSNARQAAPGFDAGEALREFAEDYRRDPMAKECVFGVRITGETGGEWHVRVGLAPAGEGERSVDLLPGPAPEGAFSYVTDAGTLRAIHEGRMSALTAMGQARGSDPVPMELALPEGFAPDPGFLATFLPTTFHFWSRGAPEITRFGAEHSRVVHGANISVLYYTPGLRTAWVQVSKGQRVNADPGDQTNPFPSMFIGTRGSLHARIGGRDMTLDEGRMLFVPPGVTHEFWNESDKPGEAILIMFGQGA